MKLDLGRIGESICSNLTPIRANNPIGFKWDAPLANIAGRSWRVVVTVYVISVRRS